MLDMSIREQLARYLNQEITLAEFQEWYVPFSWQVDRLGDLFLREFISDTDLRLAEYTSGHLSEEDLRSELRSLIQTCRITIGTATSAVITNSFSSSETPQSQLFGIKTLEVRVS
jgi:hypothetical protein